jgi:hypothetical protein
MTELTREETHQEDYVDRAIIHDEDTSQVATLGESFYNHVIKNDKQFKAVSKRDAKVFKQLKEIKDSQMDTIKIINDWSPYITDGMKRSEAYKYVSNDLKRKGKDVKWWVSFTIIMFSAMGSIYYILERCNIVK